MSDLASSTCFAAPNSYQSAVADQPKKELADRLIALIDDPEGRIRSMRNEAVTEFTKRQELFHDAQFTQSNGVVCLTKPLLTPSVPVSVQALNRTAWYRLHTGVNHDAWKPNSRQDAAKEC